MTAATIRVRTPSGALRTFEAEHVHVRDGLTTAVGRWRHDQRQKARAYTWPARQLVEICWAAEAVAA